MICRKFIYLLIVVLLPAGVFADCNWPSGAGVTVLALSGTGCAGATVPGDLSTRPLGFGVFRGHVGMWLGTNDSYASTAYFGLEKAPTNYPNDFAIVGSSDTGTYRWLRIGYNGSDNPSNPFTSKVAINTLTGAVNIGDVGIGGAPLTIGGDLTARPIGIGMVLGKPGIWLGTNDNYATRAYFGLQKAPVGFPNDFAIVGAADAGTQRFLRIGFNADDNPSSASNFTSTVSINVFTGDITAAGALTATRVINATYQDIAEWVPASGAMVAGTVVVVDPNADNGVIPSTHAYDTAVAGVVSAQPGVLLGSSGPAKKQVATTGRVKVRVDASSAPIHPGDILVTSDKPGLAMKSSPIEIDGQKIHRPGTIIGKALQPLASGQGEILVLLSLQ
jgi:hypothetical protein